MQQLINEDRPTESSYRLINIRFLGEDGFTVDRITISLLLFCRSLSLHTTQWIQIVHVFPYIRKYAETGNLLSIQSTFNDILNGS